MDRARASKVFEVHLDDTPVRCGDAVDAYDHSRVDVDVPCYAEVSYCVPAIQLVRHERKVAPERALPICKCNWDNIDVIDVINYD